MDSKNRLQKPGSPSISLRRIGRGMTFAGDAIRFSGHANMIVRLSSTSGLNATPLGDRDYAERRPAKSADLKGDSIPTRPVMPNGVIPQLLARTRPRHSRQGDCSQMQKLRKEAKNKAQQQANWIHVCFAKGANDGWEYQLRLLISTVSRN